MIDLKNFDAVIFDMDGVLIDSEPLWKIAMEEVFLSVGSKLTKKDFQKTVGLRLDEVIHFWHEHEGWSNVEPLDVEKAIIQKMEVLIWENPFPLTGVMETLDYLIQNNYKIGLATSSYQSLIDAVLDALKIRDCFDFTYSAEFERYGKPHPGVYLHVAQFLGVSPNKCLVIEDSLNGVISAKAAKMTCVCIPEKTHQPEPKLILADAQFESMKEFLNSVRHLS